MMTFRPSLFSLRYILPYCTSKTNIGPVLLYRNQNSFCCNQRTVKTLALVSACRKQNLTVHQNLLQTYDSPWLCNIYSGHTRNGCGQLSRTFSTVYQGFNDYGAERKTFKLDVPEYYNFSRDVMDKWANAEKTGERKSNLPAVWWVDKDGTEVKWSYQDVARKSNRVANILTETCGLKPGDKVIVILPKIPQWWLLNVAVIRAGLVMSPGTTMLRKKDIVHRLHASKAACIITDSNMADMVDEVASESPYLTSKVLVNSKSDRNGWLNFEDLFEKASESFECVNTKANDPMMLFFTSGTTGSPKMTEHTQVSYPLGHVGTARHYLLLTPTSVMWNMSDTGWAKAAYSSVFAPWISGSCVFIYNYSHFDPKEVLKVLSTYPVTHFCCPPTAFRNIVKCDLKQYQFPHLKHCLCAGEPVNPEVIEEWKTRTGLMIYEGYGQSETTLLCGSYPCIDYRVGSMGKAAPGIDLQIVDENGNILPRGEEGEIGVRYKPNSPVGLFSRYVDDLEKTESRFKGDFYLTGDKAYMDEDDYIFFIGRADDVIISAGYRIGPFEVESALLEHPSVLESAVVGSPHEERGEIVKAFIILTPGYVKEDKTKLTKELQDHVKNTTAPYKYPRKIEFVKELPKTVSGKIRRVELRSRESGQ